MGKPTATNEHDSMIQAILAEELAPKRAEVVAQKIAKQVATWMAAAKTPVEEPEKLTAIEALRFLANELGLSGRAEPPKGKGVPAKASAVNTPEKAPARPRGRPRKAANAASVRPAKAARAKAEPKAPKPAKAARAKGKRKIPQASRESMKSKKRLYWTLFRELRGDEPQDGDAAIVKAADPKFVKKYRAQIKQRLVAEVAGHPPAASKTASTRAKLEAVAAPEAAKNNGVVDDGLTETQRGALGL